jgi:hypothetical protein
LPLLAAIAKFDHSSVAGDYTVGSADMVDPVLIMITLVS